MSISFYPTQAAGPQATDQPLPDYLSYSAYQTNVETVTVTRIGVVYGGDAAPSQTVVVSEEVRTQVAYSVVNLPLTYDGPLPPPPLGTGWVLPGQDTATSGSQGSTNSQGSTATATSGSQGATTETNNSSATESNSQSNSQGETATATGSDGETATSQSATQSATQPTNSNESSNVNSVSQTGTGNTNSATNSNPQNSNSASTASNPISTSNSNSATTSSQPSSTSSLPSSTSSGTSSSSSLQPTNSNGVPITPNQLNASGLSDGQIAGIVVGSVLGFLLLVLLVLLCIRRKRRNEEAAAAGMAGMGSRKRQISDKWASGFSTGGASKGNYAALGAAGAGAAAGVAAGASRSRGSLRSDEWEEDHLTGGGGSGFFVVGGKKQERNANDPTSSPTGSYGRRSSRGHIYGNIGRGSPSAQNGSGGKKKGLGSALGIGAGAGLLAAALGRSKSSKRSNNQSSPTQDQDPFSDDYDADPDLDHEEPEMTERRGLMNNFATDGPGAVGGEDGELYGGDDSEMRNAGHSGWGGGAAGALGAGALAGAALASSNKRSGHSEMEERDISGMTPSHSGSSAGVGVGAFNATRPSTRESHSRTASSHRPTSSAGGGYTSGTNSNSGRSGTAGQSHAGSGSGSGSGSATISGGGVSSASTGGRTQESPIIGASLPPPPRAPRERQAHVFGNLAPSKEGAAATLPGFQEGFGSGELGLGEPRVSSDTFDTDSSGRTRDVPNLGNAALAAGAGAAGGLGLLAAQHRDSAGSTYSKGFYPSGVPSGYGSSTDQLSEEDRAAGKRPRHSQFLSHNTNLLGPDAHTPGQTDSETDEPTPLGGSHSHSRDRSGAQVYGNLGPPSTGYAQHGRLSTIRSVGEFGERSQSSEAFSGSNSGSGSASIRGSGLGGNGSRTPGGLDEFASQYYQTGTSSPRGTMGEPRGARSFVSGTGSGASRRGGSRMRVSSSFSRERDGEGDEEDDDRSQSDAETGNGVRSSEDVQDIPDEESENLHRNVENAAASAAVGAGFFGGMAAGWHRLTMNPQTWLSGGNSSSNQTETQPLASTQEGNDQDDGAVEQFQTARHEAPTASDPGLAPDARSEHATIYRASTLGHGGSGGQNSPAAVNSSREGSGGSGSVPNEGLLLAAGSGSGSRHSPAPRSIGTSHSSSSRRGGDGYAASVSNASGSGGSMSRRSASENASIMTGLESLSQHPQASSSGASGSLSSGSRRSHGTGRGASDSGASTGAASYSPSHLARGSSSSTRGSGRLAGSGSGSGSGSFASSSRAAYAAGRQKSALGEADYENGDWDSDAQSSNATAGGSLATHEPNRPSSSSNKKKRPRSNSAEAGGNRRLSSVADLPGQEDEEEEAQLLRNLPLGGQGHFPSPSLGAAMLRQANRDAATSSGGSNHGRQGSGSGTEPNPTTPRALPKSLLPGPVPPLPPTLHTSTSSPSLGDANVPPPAIHSQEGSGSWRQSPRVASASQRASAAAAHLEASRAATLSPSKGGTLPRSGAQPRSTSEEFAWGGLGASSTSPPSSPRTRSRLRNLQKEAEQGEAGLNEEVAENEQQGGGGFLTEWPKFLRF